MKFEKFVKSLGGHGVIYAYKNSRWLASTTVLMRIPEGMTGVVADTVTEMPESLRHIIDMGWKVEPCKLTRAELPHGNSGIKDAIRIYETEQKHLFIRIDNDSYSLIEKCDSLNLFPEYSAETDTDVVKALVVGEPRMNPDDESEIVGFVFPITE